MKHFCFLTVLFVLNLAARAQNVRYDAPFPSISSQTSTRFLVANVPPNSPTLAVCSSPANSVPCTNYATTYNSAGAACPNGAQDTPQPQPSACQPTGDAQGNIGFWASVGTYDYTVCVKLNCYGPYTVTLGTLGSGLPLKVNGTPNGNQAFLNLISGSNIALVDNGVGAMTISSSGSGTTINPTNNFLPKRSNATAFMDSSASDNGTTFAVTEPCSSLSGTVIATNPQTGNDPNDRRLVDLTVTTDSSTSNPNFSNENVLQVTENASNGQALFGSGTHAKKTFALLGLTGNMQGAGQKLLSAETLNCYSMSDCFARQQSVTYAGGPINGDEGQAIQDVSYLQQQPHLNLSTVSSVTRTTCNTTITQPVAASRTVQTFTVAATTGCNVNDWVVMGQEVATAGPAESLMKITGVGARTLTGQVVGNYANGSTVTPATVLVTGGDPFAWGQDRVVVNLAPIPYTTGTVSSIAGGGFIGTGTDWSNTMVGGDATVPGCVSLTNDDYTGAPFNGTGEFGTLKSWYQIIGRTVTSTGLGIMTTSNAGDAAYHGNGVGSGAYTIRPCAKALRVSADSRQIILETNNFTWNVGDSIEEAVTPYPDVTAFQFHLSNWSPGGARRSFLDLRNTGARTFQTGINVTGNMATGGGADTKAFNTGIGISNSAIGLSVSQPTVAAINIGANNGTSTGRITWNAGTPYIGINATNSSLELQTASGGSAGFGDYIFTANDPVTGAAIARGNYGGRLDVTHFNNAIEPRNGLFGTQSNTWFLQPRFDGSKRFLDIFNNNAGGGAGTGFGAVISVGALSTALVGINNINPAATLDVTGNGKFTTGVGPQDGSFGSSATNTSAACETSFGATTLNVGGTTTDTGLKCLPANAIIDAVVYRITTTITTAANFLLGDATIAARFCSTQSTLTAGTTGICFLQADQTGSSGPRQTGAAKVRITTNANPGAGAIRLIVYYHTWTAPTS